MSNWEIMGSFFAALAALFGALTVGYITNFVAVDFRRFRDGAALASALAGELGATVKRMVFVRENIDGQISAIDAGTPLVYRVTQEGQIPVFDAVVANLGLLDVKLVEDVVFSYHQLRLYRADLVVIYRDHGDMSKEEILHRLNYCRDIVDIVLARGTPLVDALRARALEPYKIGQEWFPFFGPRNNK